MSTSQLPPMASGEAAPSGDDEAFVAVIIETMATALPEMLKSDPAFKAAVLEALGLSGEANEPSESEEGEDEDIDSILMDLEDVAEGDDIGGDEDLDSLLMDLEAEA